jgi:hypothetical protein
MRRFDCHERIKQVERSYHTALQTVLVLIRLAEDQPKYLYDHNLDLREMRALPEQLRDVYFARIFACFESILRDYWRTTVRDTKPPTKQLLSLIAGMRVKRQDTLDDVQEIREYRNHLIHQEAEATRRFRITTVEQASKCLNKYVADLDLTW